MQAAKKLEAEETKSLKPMTARQKKIAAIKAQIEAGAYKPNTKRVARALIKAFSF